MAKTRPSHLEQAAIALAALLAAVDSAVRGIFRQKQNDQGTLEQDRVKSASRATPIPNEPAERCPPNRGRLVACRWHMSPLSREYQARVTGFVPNTEWKFEGIEFDGFHPPECRLIEAKARYDQFFDPQTGLPEDFFSLIAVGRMLHQARRQSNVIRNNPPAKLTWYFMQPISHRYLSDLFEDEALPIVSILHP